MLCATILTSELPEEPLIDGEYGGCRTKDRTFKEGSNESEDRAHEEGNAAHQDDAA